MAPPTEPRPSPGPVAAGVAGAVLLALPLALLATLALVPEARGRIGALEAAVLVAVGVAGVAALLLAARARRHREAERAERHRAEVAAAAAAEQDRHRRDDLLAVRRRQRADRRDTDAYLRALEALGSARAAVRLGGLIVLERLGVESPAQRPLVVDTLCAYLRMPPQPIDGRGGLQEREVRLSAQRLLHRHLVPDAPDGRGPGHHWPDLDLDLRGAWLVDLVLTGAEVRRARFDGASFTGATALDGMRLRGPAGFADARFESDVTFARTRFDATAAFERLDASAEVWFVRAHFAGDAAFDGARFGRGAQFERAAFDGRAGFGTAEFGGRAEFRHVRFGSTADFEEAGFTGAAAFDHARFDGDARFGRARFATPAVLDGAWADDWSPARPSRWPPGWSARRDGDGGRLALVDEGEPLTRTPPDGLVPPRRPAD